MEFITKFTSETLKTEVMTMALHNGVHQEVYILQTIAGVTAAECVHSYSEVESSIVQCPSQNPNQMLVAYVHCSFTFMNLKPKSKNSYSPLINYEFDTLFYDLLV